MIKLFLSHASEDKNDFVRPLAEALRTDFKVWYDEYELVLGDPLLKKIDEGLRSCDYGIVVLSKAFFAKKWPQSELEGLFGLETTERKVILPIWKDVTEEEVRSFSLILAGRLAVSAGRGILPVVNEIKRAVGLLDRQKGLEAAWKEKFASLDADVTHRKAAEALAGSTDGVQQVTRVARKIIAEARIRADELTKLNSLVLKVSDVPNLTNADRICIDGPKLLSMHLWFQAHAVNSVQSCELLVYFYRQKDFFDDDAEQTGTLQHFEFRPWFDRELKIYWQGNGKIFASGSALLDFAFSHFADLIRAKVLGHSTGLE
jgi:hypothetical protein